jgi:hypothetical protein
MKAVLVRIAADHSFGKWNGLVSQSGEFVYVPIPESNGTIFHPNQQRNYQEVLPTLKRFASTTHPDFQHFTTLPDHLHRQTMHLDPDFKHLTYGDDGNRRGREIASMRNGDLIAFYAGLRPTYSCDHKLLYALVGLYVIEEVVPIASVSANRFHENAHTRKIKQGPSDIVVRAQPSLSGRLERCIPIGEFRNRAYRIRHDILNEWGGLSVRDGYVQRSAVPPKFLKAARFYDWFLRQNVPLLRSNY